MILSDNPVMTSNTANMTMTPPSVMFPLIQRSGQQVSYGGFNQFRLYTKEPVVFVAFANIPLTLTTTRAPAKVNTLATGSNLQKSAAPIDFALMSLVTPLAMAGLLFSMF